MDKSNELAERVSRLLSDIKELKFRQKIGGDSWVVYRAGLDYANYPSKVYKVEFQPDTKGKFVAKAYWTTPDRVLNGSDRGMYPDPNKDGVWYMTDISFGGSPVDRTIFIYSTKKGKIILTDMSTSNPA